MNAKGDDIMHITFSEAAQEKLLPFLQQSHKKIKFLHDWVGCGCADNGVPTIKLIDAPTSEDVLSEGDPFDFYFEPRHKVYYEEQMKIDYNNQDNSFTLKSDSQTYSRNVRLIP